MAIDPQEQARLQALVDASPSVQALLKRAAEFRGPNAEAERFAYMLNALKKDGIQIPHGYAVSADGKVGPGRNMWKAGLIGGALALGAPLTAGLAMGAFAPAAAAAGGGAAATSPIAAGAGGLGSTAAGTAAVTSGAGAAAASKLGPAATTAAALTKAAPLVPPVTTGLSAIEKAILALSASVPALMASKTSPEETALMNQQKNLLALQESRLRQQDPLYQAVQRLSLSILPTSAQTGPRVGPELPPLGGS
jgi:hypothetical protein